MQIGSVNFLNSLDQVVGKDVDNSSISNKVDSNYSNIKSIS